MGIGEWESWFSEFAARWPPKIEAYLNGHPEMTHDAIRVVWKVTRQSVEVPSTTVARFALAAEEDLKWLASALRDDRKRWFVARLIQLSATVPEALFEPVLLSAVHSQDPSFGPRLFVEPCERSFGSERVITYLVSVAESAGDAETLVGAIEALYPHRIAEEIIDRRKTFLLEAFVKGETNVYVRRRIPVHIRLDERAFPGTHALLVARAREIERIVNRPTKE